MKKFRFIALMIFLQFSILYSLSGRTEPTSQNGPYDFRIRFSFTDEISRTPIDGRIIVGFHNNVTKPINNPDLFDPQPTFACDFRNWRPGESFVMDGSNATCWKGDLNSLNGWYGVQAVLKINKKERSIEATGNGLTIKNIVYIEKGKMCRPLDMLFTQSIGEPKKFEEKEFVKKVNLESPLLAEFYGEPQSIQAAVILPKSYFTESTRIYPSVYVFGGWGSSHSDALAEYPQKRYGMYGFGEEKVFVFVNHECRTGYHVFCSSETNGPREETFFQELVPFIEREYRVNKDPMTRFLMGQSSGAWAGLWLLINYPEQFGGAYVGSPDPVDFTDFVGTNIYEENANMYSDEKGEIKYLLENISMKDFVGLDRIAGRGEQMYSFDATFSRRKSDGHPQRLFDWDTGVVNSDVAAFWEKHDLSKVVSRMDGEKWKLLQGKIHIYVAEDDIFGLNRPVHSFHEILQKKGLDSDILFLPSGGHNVWTDELRTLIHRDMDDVTHETANDRCGFEHHRSCPRPQREDGVGSPGP
jgi:pimeloyl-ACP methyl ester carboxylesterase